MEEAEEIKSGGNIMGRQVILQFNKVIFAAVKWRFADVKVASFKLSLVRNYFRVRGRSISKLEISSQNRYGFTMSNSILRSSEVVLETVFLRSQVIHLN